MEGKREGFGGEAVLLVLAGEAVERDAGVLGKEAGEDVGDVWWGGCHDGAEFAFLVLAVEVATQAGDLQGADMFMEGGVGVISVDGVEERRGKEAEFAEHGEVGGGVAAEGSCQVWWEGDRMKSWGGGGR